MEAMFQEALNQEAEQEEVIVPGEKSGSSALRIRSDRWTFDERLFGFTAGPERSAECRTYIQWFKDQFHGPRHIYCYSANTRKKKRDSKKDTER